MAIDAVERLSLYEEGQSLPRFEVSTNGVDTMVDNIVDMVIEVDQLCKKREEVGAGTHPDFRDSCFAARSAQRVVLGDRMITTRQNIERAIGMLDMALPSHGPTWAVVVRNRYIQNREESGEEPESAWWIGAPPKASHFF